MTESFWAIPDTKNLRTPVTILKEQAEALTGATKGVLVGGVEAFQLNQAQHGYRTGTSLVINVPFLKDYSVNILTYYHNITMFPGIIKACFEEDAYDDVENERDFIICIKKILSSDRTSMILANLISQAEAA